MEKCTCPKCKKLFFYDPAMVPYRAEDDNICSLTVYEKIMTCPYCGTGFILDGYYSEWD